MTYDPALVNTAACRSRITYIDGDKGILRYRGYPIEQLAGEELVPRDRAAAARRRAADRRPSSMPGRRPSTTTACRPRASRQLFDGLAEDPHPMGALIAAFGALGTFYPEAHKITDADVRAAADAPRSSRRRRRWPPTPHASGAASRWCRRPKA